MFGKHKDRRGYALILTGFMLLASSGPGWAEERSPNREQGTPGSKGPIALMPNQGAPEEALSRSAQTAPLLNRTKPRGNEGLVIVISDDGPPVIKFAGGSDAEIAKANAPADRPSGAADLLSIQHDVSMAKPTGGLPPALQNMADAVTLQRAEDLRQAPPRANDRPDRRAQEKQETTVAALPPAKVPVRSPNLNKAQQTQKQEKIEQAQLVPNTVIVPKYVVPPRTNENTGPKRSAAPVVMPSPRKPAAPVGVIEQVALAPNLGKSPKESVLRAGPSPDNKLVELVETPSDQALQLSAGRGQLLNLGAAVTDVFVADPAIADVKVVSPKKLFVHGNQLGRTNIFGIGTGGDIVFGIDLRVVPDAEAAQAQIKVATSNGEADIQLVSDRLVANGIVSDVGEAMQVAAVAEQLTATEGPTSNDTVISGSQQVNLRVRFAEVSRDDVVNLGVNWNALANTGDFLIGLSNGPDIGDLAGLANDLAGDGSTSGGIPGTGDINVEAFIEALHQEGIISLLAEPNLTAVNGETGEFLAGSEVPIPTPGPDGQTYIEYKQVGVSLEYIPTLLPGNRINLRLRPEVSSPSPTGGVIIDGFSIPAFTVRRTETSVELASGQTMALAGLFQRDISTDINKFPILGDLPILGQLFRSERYQRSETELVILITPYLVEPFNNANPIVANERIDVADKPLAKNKSKPRVGFIIN